MTNATITLSGEGIQDLHTLNLQILVEATVTVDTKVARKRAIVWLVSEVGNMLSVGIPKLVIGNQAVWRYPVLLTSSQEGIVGEVGQVDVDTMTGKPAVNDELKDRILANVQQLISPALYPAV